MEFVGPFAEIAAIVVHFVAVAAVVFVAPAVSVVSYLFPDEGTETPAYALSE